LRERTLLNHRPLDGEDVEATLSLHNSSKRRYPTHPRPSTNTHLSYTKGTLPPYPNAVYFFQISDPGSFRPGRNFMVSLCVCPSILKHLNENPRTSHIVLFWLRSNTQWTSIFFFSFLIHDTYRCCGLPRVISCRGSNLRSHLFEPSSYALLFASILTLALLLAIVLPVPMLPLFFFFSP